LAVGSLSARYKVHAIAVPERLATHGIPRSSAAEGRWRTGALAGLVKVKARAACWRGDVQRVAGTSSGLGGPITTPRGTTFAVPHCRY
jgi:hypothetical protein